MGIASFVLGILSILGACVDFIPGMAWANCFLIPIALLGVVFGLIAIFPRQENKVFGGIGLALSSLALVIALVRTLLSFLAGGFGVL